MQDKKETTPEAIRGLLLTQRKDKGSVEAGTRRGNGDADDRADQVGRSAMQNEGMFNVQIVRIGDAFAQLARLESALPASFTDPNWSNGATRRDNIISKKELKNVTWERRNRHTHQDRVGDV